MTRTRRTSLTIAMAGAVAFGAVALAPAASDASTAAVDGSYEVVDGNGNGNGPAAFLLDGTGRAPVFFCDPENLLQRHTVCQADPGAVRY